MRILTVCTVATAKSGIPMVIFNLFRAMNRTGMELGYVSINEPSEPFASYLNEMGISTYVIPRKISNPIKYVMGLAKVARGYDIIHVHGNSATMCLEMLAAFISGVKVRITHSHNTTCKNKIVDKLSRPLFHYLNNGRLACGIEAGEWLYGSRPFKVINNGVETSRFTFDWEKRDSLRLQLGITEAHLLYGHIGNFAEQKNHQFLLQIFAEISRKQPTAKLVLLGYGPLREATERQVENLGLTDNVIFAGSVDRPEYYLQAIDLIIMPSLFEGLPLTMVEEQAAGLPILASTAITPDADMTGLVTYKSLEDSAESWAKTAISMLNDYNSSDREERSTKAIAQIRDNGYDIKESARQLIEYYANSKI